MTPRNYRVLIVLSVFLPVTGAAIDLVVPGAVPPSLTQAQALLDNAAPKAFWVLAAALWVAIIGLNLAATWGLFFFRKWGRKVALASIALSLPVWPIFGFTLMSGWATALMELGTTLWGAAVALAYYSTLQVYFIDKTR
jgi:hypothetical protein